MITVLFVSVTVVFPAQAGMNRRVSRDGWQCWRVPRTGGDEPMTAIVFENLWQCSPHRRG